MVLLLAAQVILASLLSIKEAREEYRKGQVLSHEEVFGKAGDGQGKQIVTLWVGHRQ